MCSKQLESLESRNYFAVTASFDGQQGVLSILGDNANNAIVVSRDAAGTLLVNGGAIAITGGPATVANTDLIEVLGQDGNDSVTLDGANGVLPASRQLGGAGDDTLTGGSGNDTLIGGGGIDQAFGQAGNDRMIWNPGDASDLNDGGAGIDTVEVNGGNVAEAFLTTALDTLVLFERIDPAPFSITMRTFESLVVNANDGDDTFLGDRNLPGLVVDGGAGNDTIIGSGGADTLLGGDGVDFIDGNGGGDLALMGGGDDFFQWDPGDGSDTVEGQDGRDTMLFNASNDPENFDLSANGNRVRFLRTVANAANVTMDLNDVEEVDLGARGGADTIVVNDLSATDLTALNLDLDSALGTGTGDNASDSVIVNGTNGNDGVQIASFGLRIAIGGLFPFVNITGEDGLDKLTVNTLGGNDVMDAANLFATNASQLIKLTENGGAGNDTLIGSQGADTFVWNPGDGSDTIEGGDNPDTMIFNGSDLSEKFDISANGSRVRFTRDVGGITMDLGGVDAITVNPLGGADTVTVNDLTGTALTQIILNLAGSVGGTAGDGQADSVVVNGTNGADSIPVIGNNGAIIVNDLGSLPYSTLIRAVEATDTLRINGGGGNDTITAVNLETPVKFTADGGAGNDTLIGSKLADLFAGGDGNDVIDGGTGGDTIRGGAGNDTVDYSSRTVAITVGLGTISDDGAAGEKDNVATDIETILGGSAADTLKGADNNNRIVGNGGNDTLIGLGGNDVLEGGDGNDVIDGGTGGDTIRGGAGNDTVDYSSRTVAITVGLGTISDDGAAGEKDNIATDIETILGGSAADNLKGAGNNNRIVGNGGNDTLIGLGGNDTLEGGAGTDLLDGGDGNDVEIQ